VGGIRARVRLDHFTLVASRDAILNRESSRSDDTGDWAAKTVDYVLPELADGRYAVHLDAEKRPPPEIAAEIVSRSQISRSHPNH